MKNSTKVVNGKSLLIVSKDAQKSLSIPTKKLTPKATVKATVAKVKIDKVAKVKKPSLHKALLECNSLDKKENFSLSGALNRLKKQIFVNVDYKNVSTDLLNEALTFDNLLKNVSAKCIERQRFTVYSLGLAVNKYLKNA
jgi:hypothetical protein